MEIYLDNAATSHPKPDVVLQAVQQALTEYNGNPGRSGHQRALAGARLLSEARETLSSFLHAPQPENIVFCFNGTDALNTAIKGSLCVGDHVITSALEHNSVLRVLEEIRSRGLIEMAIVPPEANGMVDPEKLRAALRRNTRLCVLTHVSNVTGAIQPAAAVGEIMRAHGVRYLIDGAQAVGHLPVDVQALGCDLYAFPGHKGLLGPQGTGALYIAPEMPLRPFREGGTGSSSDSMKQPAERPECFESGTVNLPGIAGLAAATAWVAAHQAEYRKKEKELTTHLLEGLRALPQVQILQSIPEDGQAGVVSFNIGDYSSSEAADALAAQHIAVRGGLHCAPEAHRHLGTLRRGAVRASLGWQNTQGDVDAFLQIIRTLK